MQVSLIFTVLNEAGGLEGLLDSIAAQTRMPDEVVVCDGGSSDSTVAILRNESRFRIQVIEAPGANISRGRNIAIAAASHQIIACTDAGVRLDPSWLGKLVEPLEIRDRGSEMDHAPPISNPQAPAMAVAGFFLPDPRTTFEVAMSATVLPLVEEIQASKFLPSSRSVAFRKAAWAQAGKYPEWLDYCEDLIFDLNLRKLFGPFPFVPQAIAYFRPRGNLRAFYKQYYLYARGDGKADLFLKRHLIRYATYLVALPGLLIGIVAGPAVVKLMCIALLIVGAGAYLHMPYRRLARLGRHLSVSERIWAGLWVPVIRVVGDAAKMMGYPAGVLWRMRRKQKNTTQSV